MEELARMLGIKEEEARNALGVIADTEPNLEISDNISNFLDGTEALSNLAFNQIMLLKDKIITLVENYFRKSY